MAPATSRHIEWITRSRSKSEESIILENGVISPAITWSCKSPQIWGTDPFVNAAIQGTEEHPLQLPWLVQSFQGLLELYGLNSLSSRLPYQAMIDDFGTRTQLLCQKPIIQVPSTTTKLLGLIRPSDLHFHQ